MEWIKLFFWVEKGCLDFDLWRNGQFLFLVLWTPIEHDLSFLNGSVKTNKTFLGERKEWHQTVSAFVFEVVAVNVLESVSWDIDLRWNRSRPRVARKCWYCFNALSKRFSVSGAFLFLCYIFFYTMGCCPVLCWWRSDFSIFLGNNMSKLTISRSVEII
jgi:hypothetical protein